MGSLTKYLLEEGLKQEVEFKVDAGGIEWIPYDRACYEWVNTDLACVCCFFCFIKIHFDIRHHFKSHVNEL